jgi:hypothetical protein
MAQPRHCAIGHDPPCTGVFRLSWTDRNAKHVAPRSFGENLGAAAEDSLPEEAVEELDGVAMP